MKNSKTELDVDFIGGMGAPTPDEEKAITNFIKSKNKKSAKTDSSALPSSLASSKQNHGLKG